MVFEKPGLFGHHILQNYDTRRPQQTTKGATAKKKPGLPEPHHFVHGVFETRVKSRRCQSVGSRVGNSGLQCPQASAFWACSVPFWEHQASGARCESKLAVFLFVSSLLFGEKSKEAALTAPKKG